MSSGNDPHSDSQAAELTRLDRLAKLLDASIQIPFTRFRIGLDALVGLIPGVGDMASALISAAIIYRGWRLGVGPATVFRMLWNLLLDLLIGTIPVVGDLFDMVYKANLRNVELIKAALKNVER